jgi:hypothetical protein
MLDIPELTSAPQSTPLSAPSLKTGQPTEGMKPSKDQLADGLFALCFFVVLTASVAALIFLIT